jgi:hypothetical protein
MKSEFCSVLKKIGTDIYRPKNAMDKIELTRTVKNEMIPKVGLGKHSLATINYSFQKVYLTTLNITFSTENN